MKTIWIMPHRDQGDDEEVVCADGRGKLSTMIDLSQLPGELILGIPETVLREHASRCLIFGQFIRRPESCRSFYVLSVPAGTDKDGRTVYLTMLSILNAHELTSAKLVLKGLPDPERSIANELQERLDSASDFWAVRVYDMLVAVARRPDILTFANTRIKSSPYRPAWTPGKQKRLATLIVASTCIVVCIAAVFFLRNCSESKDLGGEDISMGSDPRPNTS